MRWSRANLEEKQELRAATSASAKRHAEGMWHDVTRKGLDRGRDREADIRWPMSVIVPISSALPPKADVAAVGRESPKLTLSGHSWHWTNS